LRSEQDELARVCEEILQSGSPGLMSFDLPLKNTRDIYYRRAELNADRGHPIKGFEELVENLKKETELKIGIHSVDVGPREFMLFTTPDLSRLIGKLVFPATSQASPPS